jgi:hypothetical protein
VLLPAGFQSSRYHLWNRFGIQSGCGVIRGATVKKLWFGFFALVLLGLAGFGIYCAATRTTLGLMLSGGAVSSSTLVGNLSSSDRDLVMTSLELLKSRNDPAGQQQARALLGSSDDYIWFNAALYLAVINDKQAIPYLIKGLKHPASRAYADVVKNLQALTGQSFGMDQAKWIEWWNQSNANSKFSFTYASLEKQAAEIQTGSNILINRVIDPLNVSHAGSPITLIGLRLKAGANAAQAQRLLETAILGQFAEIERDGDQPTSDGSVPALIYWIPDTINSPDLAASMRRGLPAVPFAQRTSVQAYLLQSGLYELDLSMVRDPVIRGKVQAFSPATKPADSRNTREAKP